MSGIGARAEPRGARQRAKTARRRDSEQHNDRVQSAQSARTPRCHQQPDCHVLSSPGSVGRAPVRRTRVRRGGGPVAQEFAQRQRSSGGGGAQQRVRRERGWKKRRRSALRDGGRKPDVSSRVGAAAVRRPWAPPAWPPPGRFRRPPGCGRCAWRHRGRRRRARSGFAAYRPGRSTATPTEMVTRPRCSPVERFISSLAMTARRMWSATVMAARSAVFGSTTANSSPP